MGPRRITMEDSRDRPEAYAGARTRLALDSSLNNNGLQDEKENIGGESEDRLAGTALNRRISPPFNGRATTSRMSGTRTSYATSSTNTRPLSEVPLPPQRAPTSRQIQPGFNRPGRVMKAPSAFKYSNTNVERVEDLPESDAAQSENEYPGAVGGEDTETEDEQSPNAYANSAVPPIANGFRLRKDLNPSIQAANSLMMPGINRPRRSASLSEAPHHDDYRLQVVPPQHPQHPSSRPGTSQGFAADAGVGARRVAPEERERQELEARAAEYGKYRREEDIMDEARQAGQSPSPTSSVKGKQNQRSMFGHRRRDSDTLRALANPGSPTRMDDQARLSPTAVARHGRLSPGIRERISPPRGKGQGSPGTVRGRLSPQGPNKFTAPRDVAKHRWSGTTPDPVTAQTFMANSVQQDEHDHLAMRNEERERERDRDRDHDREREQKERKEQQQPSQPQQVQKARSQSQAPQARSSAPPPPQTGLGRHLMVNKKAYARLDQIGKGGSSKVYRVMNSANELYAIKRVSLDRIDAETMSGYMNEIALLKRLDGNNRIIKLLDSEVKGGPGSSKGYLMLVMECGEVDFAKLLQQQMQERLNLVWVGYYWQQMLQAVHVIHEEKIVHSDLKPANFVLVRGQLKLIDFGIANAIANDTTNIQRDHQIGTVNYMSPEAIELPDGMRRLKVGRPSDVWSLGCILYQMVYGHPPFQHLSVYQKMKAIPDISHVIDFPEYAVPSVPVKPVGTSQPEPPVRLEHLRKRVPKSVVESMKSCLCRSAKERATIPQLLAQEWVDGLRDEVEKPKPKPDITEVLGPDETVINPYYMRQLLEYGMGLGAQGTMSADELMKEAERLVGELRAVQMSPSPSR